MRVQQQKLQQQNMNAPLFGALLEGDNASINQILSGLSPQQQSQMPQEQIDQGQINLSPNQRLQIGSQYLSPQQYSALEKKIRGDEKLQLQRESQRKADIQARQKAFAKERSDINHRYQTFKKERHALEAIEKLSESGKLSNPAYISFLRKIGLDIPALMSNEDVEVIKLRQEFLPRLKSIFGGDVSNTQLEQFLKGLPDLIQTDEGKNRLTKILKLTGSADEAYYKAMRKLEKEYGDDIPWNIGSLINEYAEDEINKIGDELNKLYDFKNPVNDNQQDVSPQSIAQPPQQNIDNNTSNNITSRIQQASTPILNRGGNYGALDMASRQIVRPSVAVGSTLASIPKNVVDFATAIIPKVEVADIPEDVRKLLPQDFIKEIEQYKKNPQPLRSFLEGLSEYLPSKESTKNTIAKFTGLPDRYINPQNSAEEFIDEFVSDAASTMAGGGTGFLKSLAISGLGNLAKLIPKSIGLSKGAQEGTKIGTMLLTSWGLGPKLKDVAEGIYDEAKVLAKGKRLPADHIKSVADKIENEYISKGAITDEKKVVENIINQIKDKIPSKNVTDFDLSDIWQMKKDMSDPINKIRQGSEAQKHLGDIRSAIDTSLKNSPHTKFSNLLSKADKLYAGVKEGSAANDYILNTLKNNGMSLNSVGAYKFLKALISNPLVTSAAVGVPWAGVNGLLMINNMLKNPEVRKQYIKFIGAGLKRDAHTLIRSAKEINKQSK